MDLSYGAFAGLSDDIQGESVIIGPFLNIGKFGSYGIASFDAEAFQNGKYVFVILGSCFLGLFYRCDAFLMPCNGNRLDIANAAASPGNAVLHQIFNERCGKAKLVIQI